MVIKGEWAEPCKNCGAMDSCCETSKARLETADGLARSSDARRVGSTDWPRSAWPRFRN